MADLCGNRATGINNTLTCGKAPHDVQVDPVHRFGAGDPASLEWVDPSYSNADRSRSDQVAAPPPSREARPLGWLFEPTRLAKLREAMSAPRVFDEFPEGGDH